MYQNILYIDAVIFSENLKNNVKITLCVHIMYYYLLLLSLFMPCFIIIIVYT